MEEVENYWQTQFPDILKGIGERLRDDTTAATFIATVGMDFNEDAACTVTTAMWLTLGTHLNAHAVGYMGSPTATLTDLTQAARIAVLADACYWQATGTAESLDLVTLLKESE